MEKYIAIGETGIETIGDMLSQHYNLTDEEVDKSLATLSSSYKAVRMKSLDIVVDKYEHLQSPVLTEKNNASIHILDDRPHKGVGHYMVHGYYTLSVALEILRHTGARYFVIREKGERKHLYYNLYEHIVRIQCPIHTGDYCNMNLLSRATRSGKTPADILNLYRNNNTLCVMQSRTGRYGRYALIDKPKQGEYIRSGGIWFTDDSGIGNRYATLRWKPKVYHGMTIDRLTTKYGCMFMKDEFPLDIIREIISKLIQLLDR